MNKQQQLYNEYLEMQSKEWKENIINWEDFEEPGTEMSIKVNFKSGMWLRVYRTKSNEIEWY